MCKKTLGKFTRGLCHPMFCSSWRLNRRCAASWVGFSFFLDIGVTAHFNQVIIHTCFNGKQTNHPKFLNLKCHQQISVERKGEPTKEIQIPPTSSECSDIHPLIHVLLLGFDVVGWMVGSLCAYVNATKPAKVNEKKVSSLIYKCHTIFTLEHHNQRKDKTYQRACLAGWLDGWLDLTTTWLWWAAHKIIPSASQKSPPPKIWKPWVVDASWQEMRDDNDAVSS